MRLGSTALVLVLAGCNGVVGSTPTRPESATAGACAPGRTGLRRLGAREYARTIEDVLGVPVDASMLPVDPRSNGFDNNAEALTVTGDALERYLTVAESAVAVALPSALSCTPGTTFEDPCVRETLTSIAERAYRRPLDAAETDALAMLHARARMDGADAEAAVATVIEAILIAPSTLYLEPARINGRLDDYALASRLSYFLWSGPPDAALLARARAGELADPENVRDEVARMLADPKAARFTAAFTDQWLEIEPLASHRVSPSAFPAFDAALLPDMIAEAHALVHRALTGGELDALLLGDRATVTARLARHYGISAGISADWSGAREVTLPPERRGLLGTAAVLTATSHPDRTAIPHRGMWVMTNLLCLSAPPPPPNDVDTDSVSAPLEGVTQRERLRVHREQTRCRGCHATMDELGFGLERFDAVGALRDQDNGAPIDARGTLPDGRSFDGAIELAQLVRDDGGFASCVAQNLLAFALGRAISSADACQVDRITQGNPEDGAELIARIATAEVFTHEAGGAP